MAVQPDRKTRSGTEYVRSVTTTPDNIDPSGDPVWVLWSVHVARPQSPPANDPGWKAAEWHTYTDVGLSVRQLVGPAAGAATDLDYGRWDMWIKVGDSTETVIDLAGELVVF